MKLKGLWNKYLKDEIEKKYFKQLQFFLEQEKINKKIMYPDIKNIFNAFNLTPFENIKVVILGQDPYHGENQAHGLSFSVPKNIKTPPSLKNIYKELQLEYLENNNHSRFSSGDLTSWAHQGVFLLNSMLTVEAGKAGSHQKKGWETFTDRCIKIISEKAEGVIFLLWGAYAQKKIEIIDSQKHIILQAPHPSPLSAYRGFFGCNHFTQANIELKKRGKKEIDWLK